MKNETLQLEIISRPARVVPTLEPATALIQVTLEFELEPESAADRDGYDGQFQILGGTGPVKDVLFTMRWGGWGELTTPAGRIEFPFFWDRFAVLLENGTEQTIQREQRVLRSRVNLDPSFSIRLSESLPPGVTPKAIPHPDDNFPWDYPLAPWPQREQAQEAITARAVLIRRSPHKPATLIESNTLIRAF
jgi:hypothetical protein